MEKEEFFELVKRRYACGYWDKNWLRHMVWVHREFPEMYISEEEYEELTGERWSPLSECL